jgi:hypothetical protein
MRKERLSTSCGRKEVGYIKPKSEAGPKKDKGKGYPASQHDIPKNNVEVGEFDSSTSRDGVPR